MVEQVAQTHLSTLVRSYKMTIEIITLFGSIEIVNITHEDGRFTSMTKEAYDEMIANEASKTV